MTPALHSISCVMISDGFFRFWMALLAACLTHVRLTAGLQYFVARDGARVHGQRSEDFSEDR